MAASHLRRKGRRTAKQRAAAKRNLEKARAARRARRNTPAGKRRRKAVRGAVGAAGFTLALAGHTYVHGYANARRFGMDRKSAAQASAKYSHSIPLAKVRRARETRKLRKMGY